MIPKNVSLVFPSEGLTIEVGVSVESHGLYRLQEHPVFAVSAAYGDLIRCRDLGDGHLEFLAVVEGGELERVDYVLAQSVVESAGVVAVLAKVVANDGYWQRYFGGCLTVYFRADRYDPRADLENLNA